MAHMGVSKNQGHLIWIPHGRIPHTRTPGRTPRFRLQYGSLGKLRQTTIRVYAYQVRVGAASMLMSLCLILQKRNVKPALHALGISSQSSEVPPVHPQAGPGRLF